MQSGVWMGGVAGVISLRPYQSDWIDGLRQSFRAGYRAPLGVLPTGGGKTVCFSYLTSRLVQAKPDPFRVALLVHREELVDQICRTLNEFDVAHGRICAGSTYDRRLLAHVASVFTLVKRLDRVEVPDYVIVDEAHHAIGASTWGKVLAYWRAKNPELRIIGVTATPERLSGEGLGETFDDMVLGPTTAELVELGALTPYRLFAPKQAVEMVDEDGNPIGKRGGDYIKGAAAAVMDRPVIVGDTIATYRKFLNGAPTISFEVSVQNAEHMAEQFRAAGYRAMSIDGKMDKSLRRAIVADFARGAINVLTSCELVSEGFDIPGAVGAILRRPTWSLAMYLQQVGRTFRVAPGKTHAILCDQVGNSLRHGMPDDPREWSLTGRDDSRKTKAGEAAGRQCPSCYAVSPAAAAKCRECGKAFPIQPREIEQVDGELSEIEVARMKRDAARAQAGAETYDALVELGRMRKMKHPEGWARHVIAAREAKHRGRASP